ncbi:cytochrome P450 Tp4149-like [Rutidosis leptorrhynchoides]|uniref:cytochrome P450 Tp4149-like n=1 Tax=Rutidosis leptorrhynchoides TaxID=125765 RepID=UPI003A9A13E6
MYDFGVITIPHRSIQKSSKKYGPIMMIQLGTVHTLVISSPEAAKEIYKTHDLLFSSRPLLTIPNLLSYGSKEIVFSTYGEHWRQLKSLVVQNILSTSRVKSFHHVRKEEINATIRIVGESCGRVIDLTELLLSHSSNIICRVAFGRIYSEIKAEKAAKEFDEFIEGIVEEHVSKKGWGQFAQSNNVQDDILLDIQPDKTTDFTLDKDTLKAVILNI